MVRIWLALTCLAVAVGCSGTRKVVVNNGYPGVINPPGFEAKPARGAVELPTRQP